MGSPNGGSSNNFGSISGVITALNETNKRLRLLTDVLCCQNNNASTTIINSGGTSNNYNTINHHLVNQASGPLTIAPNTVHCISYMVLNGELNISINNNSIAYPEGYSSSESVSGLIQSQYIFTPVDASSSAIIITTTA